MVNSSVRSLLAGSPLSRAREQRAEQSGGKESGEVKKVPRLADSLAITAARACLCYNASQLAAAISGNHGSCILLLGLDT